MRPSAVILYCTHRSSETSIKRRHSWTSSRVGRSCFGSLSSTFLVPCFVEVAGYPCAPLWPECESTLVKMRHFISGVENREGVGPPGISAGAVPPMSRYGYAFLNAPRPFACQKARFGFDTNIADASYGRLKPKLSWPAQRNALIIMRNTKLCASASSFL